MFDGWWFPPAISRHALAYDQQFARTLVAAAIIFVLAQGALAVAVWRFRTRAYSHPAAGQPAGSRAEILWTAATAVLFLGLLGMGARTWAGVQFTAAPAGAETIEVLGRQFAWSFRYPGPDGRFGRTDIQLVNDANNNPFGLDDGDAAAHDDIVSATLRVPAGREVNLILISRDVIHSLFLRELRVKQDLVPGMRIPLHFQADVPGTYEVPCAELCGLGHHQMRTTAIVMPARDFDLWKRGQIH
jgi:Heme/copper-type cytochrome/quinol oxidases, subunit 2